MIISHKHKFIFIHIPKCAGTSVYTSLCKSLELVNGKGEPTCDEQDYMLFKNPPHERFGNSLALDQHCDYAGVKNYFDEKGYDINEYFKFTFVRNPWARTVSYWIYGKDARSFRDYCIEEKDIQFYRIKKPDYHELGVDYVGKVENMNEDLKTVCNKIGIPNPEIYHHNESDHKHYTEYYNEKTQELIAKNYELDISNFSYKFGD